MIDELVDMFWEVWFYPEDHPIPIITVLTLVMVIVLILMAV